MTAPLAPNQVAARLDRLPVGRFHRRFLGLLALPFLPETKGKPLPE